METLIIVDFQKDFARPSGSLYVKGAEDAEIAIIEYIIRNHEYISDVVFTIDWHSIYHCSFKRNGGIWPVHCLQYSEGAGISDRILECVNNYNIQVKTLVKGDFNDIEEYGAFEYIVNSSNNYIFAGNRSYKDINSRGTLNKDIVYFNTKNLVICGIAGDYCVKETIKNILKCNDKLDISVLLDGVASIDDGTTINEFIKENNLKIV